MLRSIRPKRARPLFDASVDQTEARKPSVRRFGRSDRSAQERHRFSRPTLSTTQAPHYPPCDRIHLVSHRLRQREEVRIVTVYLTRLGEVILVRQRAEGEGGLVGDLVRRPPAERVIHRPAVVILGRSRPRSA
jgi:hypothetical protein